MAERELRISTPLVLAADPEPHDDVSELPETAAAPIDDSTPERVAEGFYDAWRRRRWERALEVSAGTARHEVLEKQARDAELPREERIVVERMWDALANAPLTLGFDEAEMLGGDRHRLHGTAEYQFVNRPYRRRVEFEVEPSDDGYRVSRMRLGEVLTELPPMFEGASKEERP